MVEILGTNGTKEITLEACRTVFGSIGSSFSSRTYTITNGVTVSGGGTESVTTSNNLGTFVTDPIDGFSVGKRLCAWSGLRRSLFGQRRNKGVWL